MTTPQKAEQLIKGLADILTAHGYTVLVSKSGQFVYIRVMDETNEFVFEFNEVPYRWVAYRSLKPSQENGSSKTVRVWHIEHGGDRLELPPIDEILECARPKYDGFYKYTWEPALSHMKIHEYEG